MSQEISFSNSANEGLIISVVKGDLLKLNASVENDADVNYSFDEDLWNDLWENDEVIPIIDDNDKLKELIEYIRLKDWRVCNALTLASFLGSSMEIIERLVELGANINNVSEDFVVSPLLAAILARHKKAVRYLLDKGAVIDKVSDFEGKNDVPLLNIASGLGFADIVEVLIDKGVDIDEKYGYGGWDGDPINNDYWSSLHTAVYNEHKDVVELLVQRGADTTLDENNDYAYTPLYLAIITGNPEIVALLLEKEPNNILENQSLSSYNAFDIACTKSNNYDFVETERQGGISARYVRKEQNYGNILAILFDHLTKRPMDETDKDGNNHLYYACKYGTKAMVELFLNRGLSTEGAVIGACLRNNFTEIKAIVELLLDRGSDINAKDKRCGESALIAAVRNESFPIDIIRLHRRSFL